MARIFRQQYRVHLPKRKNEEEEFGPGKPGVLVCRRCESVYYRKSWRHGFASFGEKSRSKVSKENPVRFTLCPACEMIRNRQHEGEVVAENVPAEFEPDILNLIDAFAREAYARDPMDRVISVESRRNKIRATTTENQMAGKLARRIHSAFKNSKVEIGYADPPSDSARARIIFPR